MSLAAGEPFSFDVSAVSLKSALSLGYLITFGAMVAYAAYIWLLSVVSPAKATTYAYVNPLVAMFLGWALADEPLTFRSLGAAAISPADVAVDAQGNVYVADFENHRIQMFQQK